MGGKLTDHGHGEGRVIIGSTLGGKLGQFGGEVELFGGEASPAPPSLDKTLTLIQLSTMYFSGCVVQNCFNADVKASTH